jgi:hypothetical protein
MADTKRPKNWSGGSVAKNQDKPKYGTKVLGMKFGETSGARRASNKVSNKMWVEGKSPGYLALPGGSGDEKMRKVVQSSTQNRKTKEETKKALAGKTIKRTQSTKGGGPARDKALSDAAAAKGEKLSKELNGVWRQSYAKKASEKLGKPLAKKGK